MVLSPTHIGLFLLLVLIALVVFGPKRLPELGNSVGRALHEFRKASHGAAEELTSVVSPAAATTVVENPAPEVPAVEATHSD